MWMYLSTAQPNWICYNEFVGRNTYGVIHPPAKSFGVVPSREMEQSKVFAGIHAKGLFLFQVVLIFMGQAVVG